jgi:hypothetical protein
MFEIIARKGTRRIQRKFHRREGARILQRENETPQTRIYLPTLPDRVEIPLHRCESPEIVPVPVLDQRERVRAPLAAAVKV